MCYWLQFGSHGNGNTCLVARSCLKAVWRLRWLADACVSMWRSFWSLNKWWASLLFSSGVYCVFNPFGFCESDCLFIGGLRGLLTPSVISAADEPFG